MDSFNMYPTEATWADFRTPASQVDGEENSGNKKSTRVVLSEIHELSSNNKREQTNSLYGYTGMVILIMLIGY